MVVALCMKKQKEVISTLETLEQIWDEYQVYSKDELNMVNDKVELSVPGEQEDDFEALMDFVERHPSITWGLHLFG